MLKKFCPIAACALMAVVFLIGCKPHSSTGSAPSTEPQTSSGYFQTPFQDESQFIVEAIVSDIAEQMFYAANHKLPDPKYFQVTATEKAGSPQDEPVYNLQVRLDPKLDVLKTEVNINGPIWSPAVYQDVASALAKQVGLTPGDGDRLPDASLISTLTDSSPETIEEQNQKLSSALEDNFKNPRLHEKAALLLGAFLLRDHSGFFYEIRSPLCRMTSHLTMAQFLNGTNSYGINGQMAEATLLTLVNDRAAALQQLNAVGTNDATVAPMVRALWTRNTGDYRLLGQMNNLSPIENIEWFSAMAEYLSPSIAWTKLNGVQQQTIDFARIANQESYSVEMGHQLLEVSLPLESNEINDIYELSRHEPMPKSGMIEALNEMPERCFTTASDGTVHVRVIGWGQWADFLQRHLCHAIQQNFYFLQYKWGVPDDAKEFASQYDSKFSGLRFYPFVERFDCTDVDSYHKSVDNGFKVTVATPQLTPASCWNWLCYDVNFAPIYQPNSNPHINEWHNHNPPPGTVYDLNPRLNHPSLINRPDAIARFEKLREMDPYDCRVINFIIARKYSDKPDYDQAMQYYQNLLPYCLNASRVVANSVYNQPTQYEKLMLQAAKLDPGCYYDLGDYEINRQEEDQAAQYFEKATDADPAAVRVASYACWRVRYYLKKGDTDKAREIADFAGDVYSAYGLEAKALFFELTSNYDAAFTWYEKDEERYDDSSSLISFCLRYKTLTGSSRFDPQLEKRMGKLFPKGMEKVSLSDFHGPPTDGVLIQGQNDTLTSYGLRAGDVILALGGTRAHTMMQYTYLRDSQTAPEMDLIVWQGSAYHEIKAAPPNHLFGVDFRDYRAQ